MSSRQPDGEEREEAHRLARPRTVVIYEAIREEGQDELERSVPSLAWSALAAGLSMTLGLLAMGAFASHLPDRPWRPLVVGLGYPLGYLIVILGRQQLFTENTLTPLLPILSAPSTRGLGRVARLWGIVLAGNLTGALGGALFLAWAQPLPPAAVEPMVRLGLELTGTPAPTQLAQGIFAGWLIALMVWLLPLAEAAGPFVIVLVTYIVGIAQLAHIIAGSVEVFYAMWLGRVPWAAYPAFFGPTLLGNVIGGVAFVTLISFAQVVTEGGASRKGHRSEPKVAGMTTEGETIQQPRVTMEEITALAKRRGFIFQSSEIYGGIGGFFDYGPLGAVLKRNVKDAWWRETVELRDDVVAFDSSIIMHPQTWVASGHVAAFHDKLVDCRNCKHRFRADHLPSLEKCPDCGMSGTLTEPRNFNLMMKTSVGPMEDTASATYLRPETAQGIFVNFKNIYQSARQRPPFGIAQIGKSFRNEITPGNFTFRVREFEQAELEYFVPDDGNDVACYEQWVAARKKWYSDYGVRADRLRFYELQPHERPHYARAGTDVEYLFPWGWGELESIAHRGTYDLDAHMKLSGKDLRFFDEASKTHYTPILIESSAGMDRTTLTMLIDAYESETIVDGDGKETKRTVLRFPSEDRTGAGRRVSAGAATSPIWSSARSGSSVACDRSSAPGTMRATWANSTAARTRSGRPPASWSTSTR